MTVTGILLGAVGVVVVIGIVGAARRRLVDEGSSVRQYQHTMDTLRRLPDHREALHPSSPPTSGRRRSAPVLAARSGPPRVTARVEEPPPSATEPEPPAASAPFEEPAVTDAAGAVRRLAADRALHHRPPPRRLPGPRRAGRRPPAWVAIAALSLASVVALALAVGPSHRSAPPAASSRAGAHEQGRPATASGHADSAPATTSVGPLEPLHSTITSATYQLGSSPYTVRLAATGPCWVSATDNSSGQVLWAGTLEAGQSHQLPSTAGMTVHLGNASHVTVAVGSQQVVLPPGTSPTVALTFIVA